MTDFLAEFSSQAYKFFRYQLYSQVPQEHTEANKYFTLLTNTINNPDMLISVLYTTESHEILYILNIILYEMLTKKWSIFEVSQKVSIYTFSLKALANNWRVYTDKKLIDYIVRLIIRISRQSWNEDLEFSKLPQYCDEFLMQNREVILIGLRIIKSLIVEMGPESEDQLMQHQRNSQLFKKWIVPVLFSQVYNCAVRNAYFECNDLQVLGEIIEIFAIILEFCKQNEKDKVILLPLASGMHWTGLRNPELTEKLSVIFDLCGDSPRIAEYIFKFFSCYICVTPALFLEQSQKDTIVEKIVFKVFEVLNSGCKLCEENVLLELISLLSKIVQNPHSLNLIRATCLDHFLQRIFLTTKDVLKHGENESMIFSCLKFWKNISKAMTDPIINHLSFEVCKIYIEYVLASSELKVGDSMLTNNSSILSPLSKGVNQKLIPWVITIFEQLANSLPQTSNKISHLIHILAILITDTRKQFFSVESSKYKYKSIVHAGSQEFYKFAGELSYRVFILGSHIASLVSTDSKLISSILYFSKFFFRLFINSESRDDKACLLFLAEKFGFQNENGVLIMIISLLFSFSYCQNTEIYELCMNLFADIAASTKNLKPAGSSEFLTYCGNLQFLQDNIEEILNKWVNGQFKFIDNHSPCKSRSLFTCSIFKLYFLVRAKTEIKLSEILNPLQALFVQVLAESQITKAGCLCCDLVGVAQSVTNSDNYTDFFYWISERSQAIMTVFELLSINGPILLLKFLKELSFNRFERLTFLADFNIGSALFRFCEKILNKFFTDIDTSRDCANAYTEIYKPMSVGIAICSNLLISGNSKSKQLIKDDSVISTIKILIKAVISVPSECLTSSIKIFAVFYELLNYITNNTNLIKSIIFSLDTREMSQLLDILIEGCQSLKQFVCQLSYCIIKNIIHDLIFKGAEQSKELTRIHSESFKRLMRVLLILVFGGEGQNISLISYPLLGLINLFKQEYLDILPGLFIIQGPERAPL